nr:MAG TPA_asm: hypothetical protein [Bacteriophage sp.]
MVSFGVLFCLFFTALITFCGCGFPLFLRLFSVAVWLFCLISATAQRCGPSILRSRTVSGCFRAWLPCLRLFRDLMRCALLSAVALRRFCGSYIIRLYNYRCTVCGLYIGAICL